MVLALISAQGPFSIDMYLPAMPQMVSALDTSLAMLQLTITGYLLGVAIGPLFLAPMSDARGRKPVISALLLFYGLASGACALAQSAEALVGLRVLQAIAGGTVMAISRAMLADLYEGDALSRATSILMSVFTIAPVVAPLFGAWLLEFADWRWIFGTLVIVAIVSLALVQLIPETLPAERRRPYQLGPVLGGYREIAQDPKARRYLASTAAFAFMFFAMLSASPFIFIEHFGVSEQFFAVLFGLISIAAIVSNFVNARLVFRVGYDGMLRGATWALAIMAVVFAVITASELGGMWGVFAGMIWLMGIFQLSIANSTAGLMKAMGHRAGAASAAMAFCRFMAGALGSFLVGAFNTSAPWPFAMVLGLSAILSMLALLLGRAKAVQGVR